MKKIIFVSIFILTIGIFGVSAQSKEKADVLRVSGQVVAALKAKDLNKVAGFVHPTKGLRFSPYGYIGKKDLVFKANELKTLLKSKKVYQWGEYDESEKPIKMTFAKYYENFVYDYNFAKPDKINYNLKQNNGVMINNIAEFYPKGVEVEYYFEPTRDRMYGSLRLVYEKQGTKWYLVGVVRDTPGI
ncbi:MAG TPA: hypothetical protein VNB22_13410 [Pyrinomonadaceae bacterium]|jgi:hypothetical protein|nr:hypothetical protein [Pyrinomonadaceae bacterium]